MQQEPRLRLPYLVNRERPYDYRVEREPVASSSCLYYLVFPQTGRRVTVRYLRSGAGSFAHREAFAAQQRL